VGMSRITTVQKSRKPGTCEKCKTDLPVGSAYRWFTVGFRSKHKRVRCLSAECAPKDSERESSLLSSVYAAREDAEATINDADNAEDMNTAISEYADAIREVASEYEVAKEDENGNVFNTVAEERQEALESAADEVESITVDDETMDCEACAGTGEIPCETCDGSGEVEDDDPENEDTDQCPDCAGTGNVDCEEENCEDGQVPDLDAMREAALDAINTDLGC
jgi:hypothetical protein